MDKIKILFWLKYKTQINGIKKINILLEIFAVIVYLLILIYSGWIIFSVTRQEINFYNLSALFGLIFITLPWLDISWFFNDQTKDLKRYFQFNITKNELTFGLISQTIFSVSFIFLLPLLLWLGLCISTKISEILLFYSISLTFIIFCLMSTLIFYLLYKFIREYTLFLLIFLILFFSFICVLLPKATMENIIRVYYPLLYNPALILQNIGEIILNFFPTSLFSLAILNMNLICILAIIILILVTYLILTYLVEKELKTDVLVLEKKKFSKVKENLINNITNKISISEDTKGLTYLQLKGLNPKFNKGNLCLSKYTVGPFLFFFYLFFFFAISPKGMDSLAFLPMIIIMLLTFLLMDPYLINYLGVENKALSNLLLFPINKKKFIIQQNLFSFINCLIFFVILSLLILFITKSLIYSISWVLVSIPLILVLISFGNFTSIFFPFKMPITKKGFWEGGLADLTIVQVILIFIGIFIGQIILGILLSPIIYLFIILISNYTFSFKLIFFFTTIIYSILLYLTMFYISSYHFVKREKKILEKFI